jgi:hypothetical protein
MITFLMLFLGIAILQAGFRMLAGHELSLVPVLACLGGFALILKGVRRFLLWIAPREPSAPS